MSFEDLDTCFSRLVDDDLDADEFAELAAHLASSAEARRHYLDWVDLHNVLDLELHRPATPSLRPATAAPVEAILRRQRKRSLVLATLAAAALVTLAAITFKLILVPEAEPSLHFTITEGSSFRVIHPDADGEPPAAGTLSLGSRFELDHGAVRLDLASGVRSVVRGPAALSLEETDRLRLEHGTAWFRVPDTASGFQVRTPNLTVVDLGTEFGVISKPGSLDEVHLFEGTVRVENHHGLRNSETLEGRGVARISGPAGRFRATEARPREFLTTLPANLLDSYPHLHWSFDGDDPLQASGSHPSATAHPLRAERGTMPRRVPGKVGHALDFGGPGDAVLLSDWEGILGRSARTFACWIRIHPDDPKGWGSIFEWGGESPDASSVWRVRIAPSEVLGESRAVLRVGFGWNWIEGETDVADGEWHHLAIVQSEAKQGDEFPVLQLYVDGQQEDLRYLPGSSALKPIETRPGRGVRMARVLPQESKLRGTLDEVHLFEAALDPGTIRRLMAADSR